MISKLSRRLSRLLLLASLLASFLLPAHASGFLVYAPGGTLEDIRTSYNTKLSRLVIESDRRMEYTYFTLGEPDRLIVDVAGVEAYRGMPLVDKSAPLFRTIRTGAQPDGRFRVVIEAQTAITVKEHFQLLPSGGEGFRVVFDVAPANQTQLALLQEAQEREPTGRASKLVRERKQMVIVDPGHGGKDPGAIGVAGTHEKDVTLAISRELTRLLNEQSWVTARMTRQEDQYLALRERTQLARRHQADFFVSIHADAFHSPEPRGPSVYTLSKRGASSETARWLAQKENMQPLVGDTLLDLSTRDDMLASVLLDLTITGTTASSVAAGSSILEALSGVAVPHKPAVEQAAFMVLRSPDIPSLLIEAGFLTNPEEEQKLRDPKYQKAIARAIHSGLTGYLQTSAAEGAML